MKFHQTQWVLKQFLIFPCSIGPESFVRSLAWTVFKGSWQESSGSALVRRCWRGPGQGLRTRQWSQGSVMRWETCRSLSSPSNLLTVLYYYSYLFIVIFSARIVAAEACAGSAPGTYIMCLGSQQARNPKTGVPGNQWLTVDVNSLNMFKPWLCGEGICTSCDLRSLAQLRCIVLLKVLMGLF